MHTAGKVLLIIGGIITALGIVMIVGGAASAGLNPDSENVWEGTSGDFTINNDLNVAGGDFSLSTIKVMSNSAVTTNLLIGDVDANDTIEQIDLQTFGTTQM